MNWSLAALRTAAGNWPWMALVKSCVDPDSKQPLHPHGNVPACTNSALLRESGMKNGILKYQIVSKLEVNLDIFQVFVQRAQVTIGRAELASEIRKTHHVI